MKIIITGALGHIGSQLLRILPISFPNSQIILIDNLVTQRYCSLFNLDKKVNYTFYEYDILTCNLDSLLANATLVIHLAAITNAAGSFEKQEEIENVNFIGTKRIAEACIKHDVKLLFLSTTSVYGTQKDVVNEDCDKSELAPQSPYATSKLNSEYLLSELASNKGLKHITCRFGTIFGTSIGMRFHTAINKFCWQAVMGQPITVWTTALNQVRPYLELNDAINSIIFIIEKDLFNSGTYNILTLNSSVKSILDLINHYNPGIQIQYVDTEIMNQLSYKVENDKFKSTGFQFQGSLERSLKETIDLLKGANNV